MPELLPIRYGRMAASSFAFFRGAALPMAGDLARHPASGLTVQACGDAHLANFGVFASPERHLVFDINDFDETLPGPVGVGRQAAGDQPGDRRRGRTATRRRSAAGSSLAAVAAYRGAMRAFAGMDAARRLVRPRRHGPGRRRPTLRVAATRSQRKVVARNIAKAQTKDNLGALGRFAAVHDGRARG